MSFNTADFHRLSMLIIVHWSFEALLSVSGAGLDGVLDNGCHKFQLSNWSVGLGNFVLSVQCPTNFFLCI